jgi:hypothetical protein
MQLILLILRLLFGWNRPSWNESVPLAVRRDGRLENRLQPREDLPAEDKRAAGPLLILWRAIGRALGRLCGGGTPPGASSRRRAGGKPRAD